MSDNWDLEPGVLETDHVLVRSLRMDDLEAVVNIDAAWGGELRREFYRIRIQRSLEESSIHLSLAAELNDKVVGFVTVTFFEGEFGRPERAAVLDAVGVHPDQSGQSVAKALLRQLEMNLRALRVEELRTEVDWDRFALLGFLAHAGFKPASRLCLQKSLLG